jgi:hypothetical protein
VTRSSTACGSTCADEVCFGLPARADNRARTPPLVQLKAVRGPDDQGEPVLTVLLPGED